MHETIKRFIHKMRLLSLASIDDMTFNIKISSQTPLSVYVANAFYAFDEESLSLIIASDCNSKHVKLSLKYPNIAVNIAKDSKIALLKGVQIKAIFEKASEAQKKIYLKRFIFARFAKTDFYALKIVWAKFTDNQLSEKIYFP
ncbi:hypothetical protein DMB95_01975 [Campylobacter sp. MIT 12-8780]|uniref:hypothetical protein n=1 Tax=unclassified Campylobacter TaxID=2593542 RepID=UPI00115E922F|nr:MULTISPECIES: hypothetical protein [unclassified Campylobacter]NDJ26769.1 hypothetical protein [Campylobacter sp. MIT 19-121]TQR42407.1 hypothetical protein DMB95_01975 [Campylobacter sp. MIT 12-8780]